MGKSSMKVSILWALLFFKKITHNKTKQKPTNLFSGVLHAKRVFSFILSSKINVLCSCVPTAIVKNWGWTHQGSKWRPMFLVMQLAALLSVLRPGHKDDLVTWRCKTDKIHITTAYTKGYFHWGTTLPAGISKLLIAVNIRHVAQAMSGSFYRK